MLDWTIEDLDNLLDKALMTGQLEQLLDIHFSAAKQFIPMNSSKAQLRSGLIEHCRTQVLVPKLLELVKERNETRYNEVAELVEKRTMQAEYGPLVGSIITSSPVVPVINNDLFRRLTRINFIDEVVFFQKLLRHEPRAALWIRGGDVPARHTLLFRLMNDLDDATMNTGKARRKLMPIDFRNSYINGFSIWHGVADGVGVKFDEAHAEESKLKTLETVCKCLKTQDFIITLRNVEDALDDDEVKASIVSFWRGVVKAGRGEAHATRLLLFLIEESKAKSQPGSPVKLESVDWTGWAEGHDCATPLRLHVAEQFHEDTIKHWYGTDAPATIKLGAVDWRDFWQQADEGRPHRIYSAACKCCNENPANFETWLRQL